MITEQQIIELAKENAIDVFGDYIGLNSKDLIKFANALHDEFKAQLIELGTITKECYWDGAPEHGGKLIHTKTIDYYEEEIVNYADGTKLYALPNDEVK